MKAGKVNADEDAIKLGVVNIDEFSNTDEDVNTEGGYKREGAGNRGR